MRHQPATLALKHRAATSRPTGRAVTIRLACCLMGALMAGQVAAGEVVNVGPTLSPAALEIDFDMLISDGNGVLEADEAVRMSPSWHNDDEVEAFATALLSNFTGPGAATYSIPRNSAAYGPIPAGGTASCQGAAEGCYEVGILLEDEPRPATHWDASADEELQFGPTDTVTHAWTLHVGDSFTDVPRTNPFYRAVETLLHTGVTGGCAAAEYCPGDSNSRGQMSVFLLKAFEGPNYSPQACVEGDEMFDDVPFDSAFCSWIQDLAGRGVTSGCDGDNYCPGNAVSRGQMAIFLLKTLEGSEYVPPACTGVFDDVPCSSLFAAWVEDLVTREITAGCGGDNYCPGDAVSRAQMGVFLSETFGLTLYGP